MFDSLKVRLRVKWYVLKITASGYIVYIKEIFKPSKPEFPSTKSRMEGDDPEDQIYCCWACMKNVGGRENVNMSLMLQNRVICSGDCQYRAEKHPSNEYEELGRDY